MRRALISCGLTFHAIEGESFTEFRGKNKADMFRVVREVPFTSSLLAKRKGKNMWLIEMNLT